MTKQMSLTDTQRQIIGLDPNNIGLKIARLVENGLKQKGMCIVNEKAFEQILETFCAKERERFNKIKEQDHG